MTNTKKESDMNSSHDVGLRISKLRKLNGLTQNELAEKMGIERTAIANYETGRLRIYDKMLKRFAIALNVTADELLGISHNKNIDVEPNLKIIKRLKEIEDLPSRQKSSLLNTIDAYLKSNKS